jgi:AMP phosphorylase
VLSKKKIMGSKYVVIDIPTGPETKMKTREEAERLGNNFIALGKMLGIHVDCAITRGSQPIGNSMGPALEAREALDALCNPQNAPQDLVDKAVTIAGLLLQLVGKGNKKTATEILMSGKAEKKMREIIGAQGGNSHIKPSRIAVEENTTNIPVKSRESGSVYYISNRCLVQIAKVAGAPKDRYAGIVLNKKLGDKVKKNEVLYTIYAEKKAKLRCAVRMAQENNGYTVSTRKMLIEELDNVQK